MSRESADLFLEAATQDTILREKLKTAGNPEEFAKIAEALGYSFTSQELKSIIKENSEQVTLRRKTGIWPWLRQVTWI